MEQNVDTGTPMTPAIGNKQKSRNGLKIVTAIACIVAVCGIGFGVYGMMQSGQKNDQIADKDSQISDLKIQIKSLEESATDIEPSESVVTTDAYENFAKNLAKNDFGTVLGNYYYWNSSDKVITSVSASIKDSHLTITEFNTANESSAIIAEADDIISAYYIEIGNGGMPYVYMIKKDGSVARIDVSKNGARTIEDLDGYEKIVSIFEGGDLYAHLIDINGNIYRHS